MVKKQVIDLIKVEGESSRVVKNVREIVQNETISVEKVIEIIETEFDDFLTPIRGSEFKWEDYKK